MNVWSVLIVVALAHLGLLFITAGGAKLRAPRAFALQLERQAVLPPRLRKVAARVVAPCELLLGIWLFSGVVPRASASACAVGLSTFVVYRGILLVTGSEAPCGCSGSVGEQKPVSFPDLVGMLANIAIATTVAVASSESYANSAKVSGAMGVAAIALVAAVAARESAQRVRMRRAKPVALEH